MSRDAFERSLKENMFDYQTRLVFADWLEENGHDDEAKEQRRMAGVEWMHSVAWLQYFAGRCGDTCTNYDVAYKNGINPVWVPITLEDVVEAGHAALRDKYGWGGFTQFGSEKARDMMFDTNTKELFWKHWQVVTGVRVGKKKSDKLTPLLVLNLWTDTSL